jgi:hypothetical protein
VVKAAIIITLLFWNSLVWSAASARIDRNAIQTGETFNLILHVDNANSSDQPELHALEQQFHILSNSRNSRHMITNGKSQSWTEWHLTLIPKKAGTQLIPAIRIGQDKTQAIALKVSEAPNASDKTADVFLETALSADEIYVQQQLLYTVRIFNSVQLDNMSLTPPDIENASTEQVHQNSFLRAINGKRYQINEITYAIFPEQPGELTIPELVFAAHQRVYRGSPHNYAGGKQIRKLTGQQRIKVLNQPSRTFGLAWLPAQKLELQQQLSSSPDSIEVGQSFTRTVTVKATGLQEQQLPPIEFGHIENAKQYPDQGKASSQKTEQGFIATRTDSAAIIPTQPGQLVLPAIELKWWDAKTQQLQTASLAEQVIQVLPSSQLAATAPPTSKPASEALLQTSSNPQSFSWQIVSALLAIGWISTLLRWQQFKKRVLQQPTEKSSNAINEAQAFKAISKACHNGNPRQLRQAILQWAKIRWPDAGLNSLTELAELGNTPELTLQLLALDNSLYGSLKDDAWNGENLLSILKKIYKQPKASKKASSAIGKIPKLYSA